MTLLFKGKKKSRKISNTHTEFPNFVILKNRTKVLMKRKLDPVTG